MPIRVQMILLVILLSAAPRLPAQGQSPAPAANIFDKPLYLPAVYDTRPYCRHQAAQHIFGVQMYGRTTPQSQYYNFLVESGAAWVRVPLPWRDVEPENTTPDKYNWRPADNIVGAATYNCLEVILTIDNAPQWAADPSRSPVPENMHGEFAQFLAALVERYDGDGKDDAPGRPVVNYIELYNEPDSATPPPLSTWGRSGALYAKLLKAATPKMRQANPNVKVLLGGIAYERFTTDEDPGNFIKTFVDDVVAGGGAPYFDYMNFHYYPSFARVWADQGPGLLEKTAALRQKLADLGVPNKPFMITETGWHSNADSDEPSTDEDQMRYVVELLTQAKVADVKAVIYFRLNDPSLTNPGESSQYHTGLVTSEDPPVKKKSFTTYQMVVEVLGPADFERTLPLNVTNASEMQAYEFTDSARNMRIYVAWLNPLHTPTTTTKPLVLPGEQATVRNVRNIQSQIVDTSDGHDDGKLTFDVSARPMIIEIPK